MSINNVFHAARGHGHRFRPAAFSLIELLTVVFIISLLIGILIPSINAARNLAKRTTTAKALDSVKLGLEMFKQDNGSDFRQTNGYPPSFSHPPIPGYKFDPSLGQFPFLPSASEDKPPVVYGAHWLPAMLMGVDYLGYVKRSNVPNEDDLRKEPWRWYTADPLEKGESGRPLERMPLYIDPGNVELKKTKDLPGRENRELFPDWEDSTPDGMQSLPVIVDAFDQPILYYVASTHGQTSNMVEDVHDPDNEYTGGPQQEGMPYYFHQDNVGFTGNKDEDKVGWDFGNRIKDHAIAKPGADLDGSTVATDEERETFARYIIDRKIFADLVGGGDRNAPLRPVNSDTFLLISAGPDARYGTSDDVNNLPAWPE